MWTRALEAFCNLCILNPLLIVGEERDHETLVATLGNSHLRVGPEMNVQPPAEVRGEMEVKTSGSNYVRWTRHLAIVPS